MIIHCDAYIHVKRTLRKRNQHGTQKCLSVPGYDFAPHSSGALFFFSSLLSSTITIDWSNGSFAIGLSTKGSCLTF